MDRPSHVTDPPRSTDRSQPMDPSLSSGSQDAPSSPGDLIRYWRSARGLSQMTLALDVGVSARHMSFVETGRSNPGRDLVIRLADRLDIPAREENALLEAAGYARRHRRSRLDAPDLERVREVLAFLLERHEPNSALVFDGGWDIVMSNDAHRRAVDYLVGDQELPEEVRGNLLRLTFHPRALRRRIVNWQVVGPVLLDRVERELADAPTDERLRRLLDEVRSYGPIPSSLPADAAPAGVLLPIHLRKDDVDLRLFSVLSTIGTAIDVTLQELRIETFFPADERSAAAWARVMGSAGGGEA